MSSPAPPSIVSAPRPPVKLSLPAPRAKLAAEVLVAALTVSAPTPVVIASMVLKLAVLPPLAKVPVPLVNVTVDAPVSVALTACRCPRRR
ncbi:hypothetical protein FLP41_15725 [Paracoccus marcusii]|uniref:hypothetical protein n=1 Tax=Paracoccus marcusii TaxID=59779 RepID=UPI002ED34AEE|nr:hypothetical protein FLP41_15725 [Paracoccus marcusii]